MSTPQYNVQCFTATWCGPCKELKPAFLELENFYHSFRNVQFQIIDADDEYKQDYMEKHQVSKLPTVLIFKTEDNTTTEIGRHTGANKQDLISLVRGKVPIELTEKDLSSSHF